MKLNIQMSFTPVSTSITLCDMSAFIGDRAINLSSLRACSHAQAVTALGRVLAETRPDGQPALLGMFFDELVDVLGEATKLPPPEPPSFQRTLNDDGDHEDAQADRAITRAVPPPLVVASLELHTHVARDTEPPERPESPDLETEEPPVKDQAAEPPPAAPPSRPPVSTGPSTPRSRRSQGPQV